MAFFKQLRLLLKHKILLRRREPTTLVLELFWPAFVFLAILIARWQFPPTFRQTCYYNAKALPSAGMVNLVQSYVCSLDNPCLNATDYEEVPNYPNASIHTIVDQLVPLVTNKSVTNVINDLPKGIRLIAAVIDTLSIASVQHLLEDGFPLRKALRPSGWRRVQQELSRLESTMVPFADTDLVSSSTTEASIVKNETLHPSIHLYDILVNANVNLMHFGMQSDSSSGFQSIRSFRDVICDHTQLEKFLVVSPKQHIRSLSRHLCLLPRKELYYLFDVAQESIDFGQILEQLSIIFRSVGLGEHQQHLDNIITMINTIDRANIFQSMNALRNTTWMHDFPKLLNMLRSGDVDVMTLLKIVNDIEPILYDHQTENEEQNRRLNELRQQQQMELLMHFYNLDDSTLKNVANFDKADLDDEEEGDGEVTTETYFDDGKDVLPVFTPDDLFDLDMSESRVSSSTSFPSPTNHNLFNDSLSRKFLPKALANMDKMIDDVESFTKTPQWDSLIEAFQAVQMILEMADDSSYETSFKNKITSTNIEKFIVTLPKKIQTLNALFNSFVPEKFQPLIYPLFNLSQGALDSLLQHLSGAFSRAIAEDKIYYFDKFALLLIGAINNGTLPRKCLDMKEAMCNFDQFRSVFIDTIDEESGEQVMLFENNLATLQGIQELGCLFFGQSYSKDVEESTSILTKLYYTLSTLNDTNQLSASLSSSLSTLSNNNSSSSDNTFWTDFTSRMLEVYLFATKSVTANTWQSIFREMSSVWKVNRLTGRILLSSRILQLSANCFIPKRIVQSPIWRAVYRKNIIVNEVLNVIFEEINESTETETLKLKQISMGSPTLFRFLEQNLHAFPVLINATFETIFTNLPQFVERMFQLYPSFKSGWPCSRPSLVDIISFKHTKEMTQIYALEDFLCKQMQMNDGDPGRIVDEFIAPWNNESRIAPLIRAIQSRSTNLTRIHEELQPLDWVEAAHSLSMLKESVEKLLFLESSMVWFPEVNQLDSSIRQSFNYGHSMFSQFYTQGNARLLAYLGDIITPFVIRYVNLNESFSANCDSGVSGLLIAPVYNEKEWRCLFVSLRYASYALKHLLTVFNDVMENFLTAPAGNPHETCFLAQKLNASFYSLIVDHIPEVFETVLNEILLGNINRLSQTSSLRELICNSNMNLDTFGPRHALYKDIREHLCKLSNVEPCARLLMPERWTDAFDHLNVTWFQESPDTLNSKASFVDSHLSVNRFFTLFGQFSPHNFNQLMAKFQSTNGESYIRDILKKLNHLEEFRNKRFAYILQTLSNEVNQMIFPNSRLPPISRHNQDRRDLLMALVYAFNELPVRLRHRYKLGAIRLKTSTPHAIEDDLVELDLLDSLLDWLDSNLLVSTETVLQSMTLDVQRLLKLFHNKYDMISVWRSFCRAPVSQYFVVDNQISIGANKAKDEICQLDFNHVYTQWYRQAKPYLDSHTNEELVNIFLIKVGTLLDLILDDNIYKRDLLKAYEWNPILNKLGRLVLGSSSADAENSWIIDSISNLIENLFSRESIDSTQRMFERVKCGLQTIPPDGFSWEMIPNVYHEKQSVLAFYSSINSIFSLGTIGFSTFLTQSKYYNHLQMLAKNSKHHFCKLATENEFTEVFAIDPASSTTEAIIELKNLQALLCRAESNFLFQLNPVSKCLDLKFQNRFKQPSTLVNDLRLLQYEFEHIVTRNKNKNEVDFDDQTMVSVPPILDIKKWNHFFKWWTQEVAPYPNSRRTLLAMRLFQFIDVFANNHVIWKAFYRLTFISSEMLAYSLRALQLSESMYPMKPDIQFVSPKFLINTLVGQQPNKKGLSSLLTSTASNMIFPEVNHFITFATYRQLRWIRHISHFFAKHPNILHDELCPIMNSINNQKNLSNSTTNSTSLVVDDDFNDLLLLLCHNHPSDWIYTLTFKSNLFNVKANQRPKLMSHRRIRERIGKLTQVLARMLDYNSDKNNQKLDHVIMFLKLKQLESIENVAGTGTILIESILATQNRTKNGYSKSTFRDILKMGWRSVPTLLDAVDQYICSSKHSASRILLNRTLDPDDSVDFSNFRYQPSAPDMKVVMCEMPQWDFDRAYIYLSKHFDLKHMLEVFATSGQPRCVTPLRFMSRWVNVGQDIFEQLSSATFWSELKSCRRRHLLSLLATSKSSSNTFLLRHSLRYVRFMNNFLSTVDKFSRDNNGVSWNNVRELWRTFSYFVLNQVPAYVPITDIVRHDVNLPEYLNATLDRISTLSRTRAKQAIRLLTDSLLDINAISWNNFSNIALKEMICKQQEKQVDLKHYYLPIIVKHPSNESANMSTASPPETLYETLCKSAHYMPIIDSLMVALDQKAINKRLNELQRSELTRGEWISDVFVPEMSRLSNEMAASGMLEDLRSKINLIQNASQMKSSESSSQKGINHLLISFVSLTRAKNFNSLYTTIKHAINKLMPRFSEGPIVDSLSRILEGLRSLKDLSNRGLFQIKYPIHDLLINVENVKIFLEHNLGLGKPTVNQILNATIDLSEFIEMSASVSFDSSAFCNSTLLFGELKLELPGIYPVSQATVTNALCTLSVTEDFKFNNQILNQLVIRRLTNNVVSLIMSGVLKKANLESSQINKALNAVRASSNAMPHVKSFIRNMSQSFEFLNDQSTIQRLSLNSLNGSLPNITLTETSDLIGKLICGRPTPALTKQMNTVKVKVQRPIKMNYDERNLFSSEFCQNGYKQIMQLQGGPVIWNFLKPILVGKILYSPKAVVTDTIMAQMNTSLRFMPRMVEMLHAWSQTLSSLESFYYQSGVNNRVAHVKHLIESVFVNGEADGLFNDIDTFNLIEKMTRSGNVLTILKLIGQVAQCASFDRFVGLDSELELEEYSRSLIKSHEFIAGIVFVGNQSDYADRRSLPTNIQYKIRIDIDFVPSTKDLKARIWEPGPRDNFANDMGYLHGFVQIQEMIDRSIMTFLTNRTVLPIQSEVYLQQQPYLCYGIDKFGNYIRSLAPLITTMAWIFLISFLIREHVLERELHLEEVMRVMGLKSGVAWLTWFIIGISVMAFATLCGITILYIGQLIPASDPVLLFLFFMTFNISLLMFCYMMSSFFKTATIASLSGIVAYLASFLPFMVAITLENEMSFLQKIVTCLSMSTSFCFGMMYMTRFEVQGIGMQWNNLWHSPMQGDTMSVGTSMIMMGVDSCIYFFVAWYISHVFPPGNNARRYPWLFFLSYSYWKYDFLRSFGFGEEELIKLDDQLSTTESMEASQEGTAQPDNISLNMDIETPFNIIDPEEWKSLQRNFDWDDHTMITGGTLKTISGTLRKAFDRNTTTLTRKPSQSSSSTISQNILGMELRGLYVIYNERSNTSKHVAVSNLNLNLKEGQITTILGRNGAGKTTTINVLTGQMQPTSGTVTIYGYRIPEDFSRARRLLGYCPQYNTLFNNLTVREHLIFFSELKGLLQDPEAIVKDVDDILHNMGLWSMQHQMAKHLSGGLKRRLCVALAFVGGSKLIILDEPTASVDPVARRRIWDLIVQQKRSRTVLLTTHHMDEAEILSDEVAVIHRGKLLTIGSPLLLKSKYGCGYQLTVSRQAVDGVNQDELLDDSLSVRFGCDDEDSGSGVPPNSMDTMIERHRSDVERLMAFTKCLIPNATFVEDNNGEVVLSLPHYDDHGVPHDYATFFRCFDSNIRTLGFGSYGVTSTTLEEVFLTLCNLKEANMPVDEAKLAVARRLSHSNTLSGTNNHLRSYSFNQLNPIAETIEEVELDSGISLKCRQLYALLRKRFLHMIRDWKLLFCTLFLPCLFIAFAMAMTLIKPSFAPDPSLPLVPQIYGQSTVSFVANSIHWDAANQFASQLAAIENELLPTDSISIDCLKPRDNWRTAKCPILRENKFESELPQHLITLRGKAWDRNSRTSCKCQECFVDIASIAHLVPLPHKTDYGWIYNLSKGFDVSQFLLRTQPEFMDRRWGGWSLHSAQPNPSTVRPEKSILKVWFDNNGFHSMPSYLSVLNNALLRANLHEAGIKNASDYRITTYSHPLHVRSNQLGDQSVMQQAGDAGIAIIILVGFIFIPTSFVFYIVRERLCEEKHLQRSFGVGPCLYWISSLFWDVSVLLISIAFASAIICFFRLPIYMARLNLPAILTLLFFFGWAMINLVYLMEKLFNEPSLAFMGIYCLALFVGIHTMVMRLMIDVFKLVDITPTIYKIFEDVAVLFPPYLLLTGIVDVHRNQLFADIFTLFDQDTYVNPFSMEMLGRHFVIFTVEGCCFFLLNLIIECGVVKKLCMLFGVHSHRRKRLHSEQNSHKDEDSDVAEERRRVHVSYGLQEPAMSRSSASSPSNSSRNTHLYGSESNSSSSSSLSTTQSASSDILRVFSVTKIFKSMFGYKPAVNNITFAVPRGECFGLLGVNGAGKTTLFRILTGQVRATSGEASFNGRNIRKALVNSCNNESIGYCPQADALDSFLTPVEHLNIYAHLRGIPRGSITKFVMESIAKFQLQPHATMPVQALSRGNRRKLCLAIAMLGNPKLILLDEPTSGLDPQSRRFVCQNIQNSIRGRRSILLTSHSMEECDILCSRLAIMVNGRFKCIGSPQYLKHKFGTGYIITLRLSEMKANFKEAIDFIKDAFPQTILRAHHHTMLEFNLPTNDVSLSTIFQVLQQAQNILSLQDYSVSQTTLDQVFVSFASQQVNDYDSDSAKSLKCVTNNNNTGGANGKCKSIKANLTSSFSVHDTKNNIKRQASLLMSLCRKNEAEENKFGPKVGNKSSKIITKSLEQKQQQQAVAVHHQLSAANLKNNILLSSVLSVPPPPPPRVVKSNSMRASAPLNKINVRAKPPSFREMKTINEYCGQSLYQPHKNNGLPFNARQRVKTGKAKSNHVTAKSIPYPPFPPQTITTSSSTSSGGKFFRKMSTMPGIDPHGPPAVVLRPNPTGHPLAFLHPPPGPLTHLYHHYPGFESKSKSSHRQMKH